MRPDGVSEREAEVLTALGKGLSNAQISHQLHISVRTVESHVSSLLRKYAARDRHALVRRASEDGEQDLLLVGVPPTRTSFIGRGRERDAILTAFTRSRLITLVGPGGVGKTRLAAEFAVSQKDAYAASLFVDLVPVRDGFVWHALARLLHVVEHPQRPLDDGVTRRLRRSRALIVLDNCEHLLDETASVVDRILSACPGVRFLLTSRERLSLAGERTVVVPPLPLGTEAEALFADRARMLDPTFSAEPELVAEICARLDGIPLAIELAAARTSSLGVRGLIAGLGDALRLLSGNRSAYERHRSLRAVVSWSFDLLDAEEQRLFRNLAVFAGGFDLDAVAAVAGLERTLAADLLAKLVDKSLVHRVPETDRWRLLDTIRAFAIAVSPTGELATTRQRHAQWASQTAAELAQRISADGRCPEGFDLVVDDLRAARPQSHDLALSLGRLTLARRFLMESLQHFRTAGAKAPVAADAARHFRDAAGLANFIDYSGGQAMNLWLQAAEQYGLAGDSDARAVALAHAVEAAARYPLGSPEVSTQELKQLIDEATTTGDTGNPAVAAGIAAAIAWTAQPATLAVDPLLAQAAVAAAQATGDPLRLNASLDAARNFATHAGKLQEAHRLSAQRLSLLDQLDRRDPCTAVEIADTYYTAITDAVAVGNLTAAIRIARQCERDDLAGRHPYLATSKLIPALVLSGEVQEALVSADHMWELWEQSGNQAAGWLAPAVLAVALAYGLRRDERSYLLWRARASEVAGETRFRQSGNAAAFATFVDARLAVHWGQFTGTKSLVDKAFNDLPSGWYASYACAAAAELAVVAGHRASAGLLAEAQWAGTENAWAAACLLRSAGRLHGDLELLRRSAKEWERIGARFERACTLRLLPERQKEGEAELAELLLATPAS